MSPYREYDERNLPVPETPDVEGLTTALDYFTEEYADISALDDKIRVRGMKWFSEHVNAEDFREDGCVDDEHVIKVGPIVLGQMFEQDDSEESEMKQRLISAISEGDVLLFEMNIPAGPPWDLRILHRGQKVAIEPWHDFDWTLLEDTVAQDPCTVLGAIVESCSCCGSDDESEPPYFAWRCYMVEASLYKYVE